MFPGPTLRAIVGQRLRVDIYNHIDTAERVHWSGVSDLVSPEVIRPHSMARIEMTAERAGAHLYHSSVIAAGNLAAGSYSGQAGLLLVDPPATRLRQWTVFLKESGSSIRRTRRGCEIGCDAVTINGRLAGHAAPMRADVGERVLVHAVNASGTDSYALALPSHHLQMTALDGHPVRAPGSVASLRLSPGESVSAWVELIQPASWEVSSLPEGGRDYSQFSRGDSHPAAATATVVLARHEAARSGLNRWSVNDVSFSTAHGAPLLIVKHGQRQRLRIHNTTDQLVPLRLQGHQLEITRQADGTAANLVKDVVSVGPYEQVEVDFQTARPASALLYSTRQWQKDFGLMARIHCT